LKASLHEELKPTDFPKGYLGAMQGISAALRSGEILGKNHCIFNQKYVGDPVPGWLDTTDADKSVVNRNSLVGWLKSRGFNSGFFFPKGGDSPGYMNPSDPRYAPKLAATVSAWLAVTEPKGKSPKQALEKWLRENAARFGLTDEAGNPINLAIEECSKIANWQPGGGASKTPSK